MNWQPLILSLKLAVVTNFFLVITAIPIAYMLSNSRSRLKPLAETLISMPLVLPPTVLGFYFLICFSPNNAVGNWLNQWLGIKLIFTFPGLVLASMIYSFPFMIQPIQRGMEAIPSSLKEAANLMGKSKWSTLINIVLPNIKPALITGMVLSFAHTLGEFGVVLMIGGNIPGRTKVASIAIYEHVEKMDYTNAGFYSLILFSFAFAILLVVNLLNRGHLIRTKK